MRHRRDLLKKYWAVRKGVVSWFKLNFGARNALLVPNANDNDDQPPGPPKPPKKRETRVMLHKLSVETVGKNEGETYFI